MPITYKVSINRTNYHPSIIHNILNCYSTFLEKKLPNWRRGQFIPEQHGYRFRQRSDLCVHLTFPDSDQMVEFEGSIPESVRNTIKFEITNDPISVIYQVDPEMEEIFQRRENRPQTNIFETLLSIIVWPFKKIWNLMTWLYVTYKQRKEQRELELNKQLEIIKTEINAWYSVVYKIKIKDGKSGRIVSIEDYIKTCDHNDDLIFLKKYPQFLNSRNPDEIRDIFYDNENRFIAIMNIIYNRKNIGEEIRIGLRENKMKLVFAQGINDTNSTLHQFFGNKNGVLNNPLGEKRLIREIFELTAPSEDKKEEYEEKNGSEEKDDSDREFIAELIRNSKYKRI